MTIENEFQMFLHLSISVTFQNYSEQEMLFTDLQASLIVTFYIIFSLKFHSGKGKKTIDILVICYVNRNMGLRHYIRASASSNFDSTFVRPMSMKVKVTYLLKKQFSLEIGLPFT